MTRSSSAEPMIRNRLPVSRFDVPAEEGILRQRTSESSAEDGFAGGDVATRGATVAGRADVEIQYRRFAYGYSGTETRLRCHGLSKPTQSICAPAT